VELGEPERGAPRASRGEIWNPETGRSWETDPAGSARVRRTWLNLWSRVHARESLSGCLVALLALAAGCAGGGSSQATSIPTVRFGDFPAGGIADGKTVYKPVLGTVEGTGARAFTVAPRTGMMFWVSCTGTGMVWLNSADIQLGYGWACDKNGRPSAWTINPTHAAGGRKVTLHLAAPAGSRWALRVDATSH
jgi:hypothetical protein